jgi:transposase
MCYYFFMPREEEKPEITAILSDIPAEKASLIESLFAEQESKILSLEKEVTWFKEQFKLAQQRKFGRSSETTETLQVEIIFNEEGDTTEPPTKEDDVEHISYTRKKTKQCGRKLDTSNLVRERQLHDLTDEEKICICGCQLEKIGEDISEQIERIPEQVKVIEHVRPKYTCRHCETIKTAPKPECPLPKSMATAGFITDVIIKKYEHHLPLYRQSKLLLQQGLEIPDNTLGNWVMGAGEVLSPLGEAHWQQLNHISVLQVDETPVKILKPDKEGYMWVYHSLVPSNRFILFEFTLTRSGKHPTHRLSEYKGILQTDGYSGYNSLRHHPHIINVGCWDHARRKFVDVVKINGNNKSGKAGEMLALIAKLYEVEAEAKNKDFIERKKLRQEKSKPILDLIYSRLQNIHAPSQSALGKAVHYCLNQWSYLSLYIDYGEIEISNCWIENQIRPFALGRRNWLFVGNEESANKSALLYSLIQTCKLNKLEPRSYLIYVLNQVHKMRRKEVDPTLLLPQFIDKELLVS